MLYPSTRFVFDRKHTASNTKKALVQVEIVYGRRKKYVSTGVRVFKNQFDVKKSICCNSFDMVSLNAKMNAVKRRIDGYIEDVIEKGQPFSLEGLQGFLDIENVKESSFSDYVGERIKARTDIRESTKRSQAKLITALNEFGKIKVFADLTKANILLFDDFLHTKGLRQTTVSDYHKYMKIYIRDAIRRDLLTTDPYAALTFKRGESEQGRYLSYDEFIKVRDAKMPTQSIEKMRDLFVFQCLTGLAYADLAAFDASSITDNNGISFVSGNRLKTGMSYCTVLLPDALAILKKYNGVLPIVSNVQYNLRLKIVADAAGIDKPIASHWGRRTCGMILLNKGVSIETVAKVLGHSSIRITESVYAKLLDETIVKEVADKLL